MTGDAAVLQVFEELSDFLNCGMGAQTVPQGTNIDRRVVHGWIVNLGIGYVHMSNGPSVSRGYGKM